MMQTLSMLICVLLATPLGNFRGALTLPSEARPPLPPNYVLFGIDKGCILSLFFEKGVVEGGVKGELVLFSYILRRGQRGTDYFFLYLKEGSKRN